MPAAGRARQSDGAPARGPPVLGVSCLIGGPIAFRRDTTMTLLSAPPSLRLAGQLLIEEVVRRHERTAPCTWLDRVLGRSPIAEKDLAWYLGAKGELAVGSMLGRLPDGWQVLHSMPVRHATDIDHIVIGPAGVFVLGTKHHRGASVWAAGTGVVVDGRRLPYIVKAERDALLVMDALACAGVFGTRVTPVVTVVGAASFACRGETEVPVVPAERLVSWLRQQPERMTADVVEELVRRLTRPGIWAADISEVEGARERFAELDAAVQRAANVRKLWALGLAGAACGAAFALLQGLVGAVVTVLTR
ncbi:MAG: hypothetical protein JWP66_1574 [Naasia sp.]|nr:hypothetical protein [Naasia sp.]